MTQSRAAARDENKETVLYDGAPEAAKSYLVRVLLAEGKNAVHVKEALGHADIRTTMGYTHLAKEHLRSLVDEESAGPAEQEGLGS